MIYLLYTRIVVCFKRSRRNTVYDAALDFEEAFDSVKFDLLTQTLAGRGLFHVLICLLV